MKLNCKMDSVFEILALLPRMSSQKAKNISETEHPQNFILPWILHTKSCHVWTWA